MHAILKEDYENLNRIDSSFFNNANGKKIIQLQKASITPKSKVVVDKITPHTFTHVLEMLDTQEQEIGAIIIRAHKRQLCLATKDLRAFDFSSSWSKKYGVIFSDYAYNTVRLDRHYYNRLWTMENGNQLKTAMSRCVKLFYDEIAGEGVRKSWDAIIIYKDPEVFNLRNKRVDAQKDIIPTPGEKNYEDYIDKLKSAFHLRCAEFLDSRRANTTTKEEIYNFLKNDRTLDDLKFNNVNYAKYGSDMNNIGNGSTMMIYYKRNVSYEEAQEMDMTQHPEYLKLVFVWKGLTPVLDKVMYSSNSISNPHSSYAHWLNLDENPIGEN